MASAKRWGGMGRAVEDIGEVLQTKFKHVRVQSYDFARVEEDVDLLQ